MYLFIYFTSWLQFTLPPASPTMSLHTLLLPTHQYISPPFLLRKGQMSHYYQQNMHTYWVAVRPPHVLILGLATQYGE